MCQGRLIDDLKSLRNTCV